MAATTSNVSYPTAKNPEMDLDSDPEYDHDEEDELHWNYIANMRVGGQREVSLDHYKKDRPIVYKVIIDLCKLALTHYQNNHAGETYEFVSVEKALARLVAGRAYTLTFRAKNLKGDIKTFEAVGYDLIGEELEIVKCHLLK